MKEVFDSGQTTNEKRREKKNLSPYQIDIKMSRRAKKKGRQDYWNLKWSLYYSSLSLEERSFKDI